MTGMTEGAEVGGEQEQLGTEPYGHGSDNWGHNWNTESGHRSYVIGT